MAYYLPNLLPLFLILSIFSYSSVAQTSGNVSVGASLTATDNTIPWLSPSQDFAFGFQKPNNNDDLFLLSIWFYKLADKTIVWYANEGRPVPRDSKVELTANRGLVLTDPRNSQLWSSGTAPNNDVAYGLLNDTGNFVIMQSNSVKIWESFSNPTDTLLPTQIMEINGVLFSRQSETNFSHGRFQLRLLEDGNLVLNTREVATNLAYDAYYISGTRDASNSSNSGYRVIFAETGLIYVLRRNDQRFNLTPLPIPDPPRDYYYRATLNFDGVFSQYYYRKNSNANQNWTSVLTLPGNICIDIRADKGRGACGYNNVCSLDQYNRPVCECPQSFSLLDPSDKYGSCKPNFTSCDAGGGDSINHPEDLYDFEELRDTDWPLSDYEQMSPYTEEDCKKSCLNDCFCAVAILRGDSCWKKKLPLSNGRRNISVNGKAFIKFWKSDQTIPAGPRRPGPDNSNTKNEKQTTLILVGSVLLGSSFLVNIVFVGGLCLGLFHIYHKKATKIQRANHNVVETNLRCFTYKELTEATNGFKEEVGRGAFGIVYKGAIDMGSINIVAVKKLDRMASENEKEFKTEVNVIGQTHHKNLVRLIGFCDEGIHRMLVYEFLSNGTLANFLFGDIKPNWKERTQVAFGIARGLLYLHEECITQIIHCDIKPQNILLDVYNNARISDFGLAKLLIINQSRTNTGIRGTKGYVAPEWFRNTPITVMVDVYSFGVLLLEIISCRRNLEVDSESPILTDWVYDCFQEGRLDVLVDNEKEALNDGNALERFVMVGIWCIQEDPSLRPTMRRVTQMLEGVLQVNVPPCPCPFSVTETFKAVDQGVH